MLEFFGLQEDAFRVFLSFAIIGLVVGVAGGAASAHGDTERKLANVGRFIFFGLCFVIGVAALVSCIGSVISLLFLFQWSTLAFACIQAVVLCLVSGFITYQIVMFGRRRRYMRNPIIKEAAAFCKQHHVVGVQCFVDGLRFFTAIEDPDYCKSEINVKETLNLSSADSYKATWKRPGYICAYDNSARHIASLRFRDRDYPNVPDLPMFADALAHKLGGCGYAVHEQKTKYETSAYNDKSHTTTITHHITTIYQDCFVYNRKSYREAKKMKKQTETVKKTLNQKKNTWE